MSKNKKMLLTLGLIIIVAVSSLLFWGIGSTEKTDVEIASYVFILLDEIIVYGVILGLTSKESHAFSVAGISSLTGIYLLISVIINTLLRAIFTSLKGILIFNFTALLLYAFIAVLIFISKKEN